jgi:hypothetical protein
MLASSQLATEIRTGPIGEIPNRLPQPIPLSRRPAASASRHRGYSGSADVARRGLHGGAATVCQAAERRPAVCGRQCCDGPWLRRFLGPLDLRGILLGPGNELLLARELLDGGPSASISCPHWRDRAPSTRAMAPRREQRARRLRLRPAPEPPVALHSPRPPRPVAREARFFRTAVMISGQTAAPIPRSSVAPRRHRNARRWRRH